MKYFHVILVFFLGSSSLVNSANILGLMGIPSPSHHIWNSVLLRRLAELGHNVTVLSVDMPKPQEKLPPNLHYIHLEKGYSMYDSEFKFDITSLIGIRPFDSIPMFYDAGWKTCLGLSRSKGMKQLLDYPDNFKFDLIFNDYTLGPMLLGFLHKFKYPPLIGVSAYLNPPNTIDGMSSHNYPAYVPYHTTSFTGEMSFWQRFENTLLFMFDTAYRRLIYYPKIDSIMRPYFSKDMPTLAQLEKHTKLSMVNSHPVITYIEPVPPNIIEIGGMQVLDAKPLPQDFENFLNNSRKNKIVMVSFGTNMKSTDFKDDQIDVILNAMEGLPQYDFIWKFDVKYLKKQLPGNVFVRPFLPQSDLLAHPKIKAFVTHCGALSTHESIFRGVPMIGVPLYFEQHRNIQRSILSGIAVELDFRTMTTIELINAIKNVVESPQIAANIKRISAEFRDRPIKPLDLAIWWTEYLLRNPNPVHLESPAAKLNIFQANSLDILFVLWTFLALFTWITVKVLLLIWRKLSPQSNIKRTSKLKTH
ncbi:UDP-glucosyltransferase 2-like [Eupeodes corollae]|uniref:UDP-glucosyltransferase 2-like n=1 Tax=Eupeodes corollae TaxID=290404 RepID=UPI002493CA9D|nr:UDP-glucosyltransferase 2-like [Eupeodes corollae]